MVLSLQAGADLVKSEPFYPEDLDLEPLLRLFGQRLMFNVPLARYTAAQIGGPAMALLEVRSAAELAATAQALWQRQVPWLILGGGSNVLVSDRGVRCVVVLNKARKVAFDLESQPPTVWAESGANFGLLSRQAAAHGLSGLEWAAGIPGSLGGAVIGNAGAHGGDLAGSLLVAEILQHRSQSGEAQREQWPAARLEYGYRTSLLKRDPGQAVVLAARLALQPSTSAEVQAKMDEFVAYRRRTQPPGASMGSMFKNPVGNFAGRLLEEAGLKGLRAGDAQISTLHANFFINQGRASASDVYDLIRLARERVRKQFGVELELEIELVGDWGEPSAEGDKPGV
jgi:UDP-N-acetylmuramate dehydrogenase